ncbi:hypothetical protein C8D87_101622 [Lentzea atacamensis]|uniref:FXSXX-COOH protein n=2 Tax=Lentzea TaxID=165301 RepID=A0ABX9EGL4_9PSEU|nr:hypothetical protein C8D87_101622 [Lentzea atacamensis]
MDSRPDLLTHQMDLTGIPLSALRNFRGPELDDAIARMMSNARSCTPGDAVQEQR